MTVLSRNPAKASERLGVEAVEWDPAAGPAPVDGYDAVVHLAGEPVAQRWSEDAKRRIRESRIAGTTNLVAGIRAAERRPQTLVCASAVGYYGPRGDEPIDEDTPAGDDFLATVCVGWEQAARSAEEHGVRVAMIRTGILLDKAGGALGQMLPPFKLGLGGPVAGGKQYMPWIHADDVVGLYLLALDNGSATGPINATAPEPVTNKVFTKALGRAIHRPTIAPIPTAALKLRFGEMAQIVVTGQNAVPKRARELGYRFAHPELDEALESALA